jgi:hypothetical protein
MATSIKSPCAMTPRILRQSLSQAKMYVLHSRKAGSAISSPVPSPHQEPGTGARFCPRGPGFLVARVIELAQAHVLDADQPTVSRISQRTARRRPGPARSQRRTRPPPAFITGGSSWPRWLGPRSRRCRRPPHVLQRHVWRHRTVHPGAVGRRSRTRADPPRMKPRSINRRIRNVAAAGSAALGLGKIHAAAGASDDLRPGPPVIRVQQKRPLPDTTAQRGVACAMQVTVSGNNAGKLRRSSCRVPHLPGLVVPC